MKKNSIRILTSLALAGATYVGSTSSAQASRWREWFSWSRQRVQLCLMDESGTRGLARLQVKKQLAPIYIAGLGARYVKDAENCNTPFDDDCNGFINEGCQGASVCGNGVVEPGEECDDGNRYGRDACTNTCRIFVGCGNGVIDGLEQCDDGNRSNFDGCTNRCRIRPICGNGVVEGEEECDDGNRIARDRCSNACRKQVTCGDGVVEGPEECDDGNGVDDDGCSNKCRIVEPSFCGNGVVDSPEEECDDGNTVDEDGCSNLCIKNPVCGDTYVNQVSEKCDDGNRVNGDGCDENCQLEPVCGDGEVNTEFEECDDGNRVNGDGCSSTCTFGSRCGNGVVDDPLEECDDGNSNDLDRCDNNCHRRGECGDGIADQRFGEECDFGSLNGQPGSLCSHTCSLLPDTSAPLEYERIGGDGCSTCMQDKCGPLRQQCVSTTGCREASVCQARNRCVTPDVGALTCVCGTEIPLQECVDAQGDGNNPDTLALFSGPCAEEIIAGVGAERPSDLFNDYSKIQTPMGLANSMFTCMARFCSDSCSEVVAPKPGPVCGNGIVEKGESCDDGNTLWGDTCSPTCDHTDYFDHLKLTRRLKPSCQGCAHRNCDSEILDCALEDTCVDAAACEIESGCAFKNENLGPLTCLCGEGISTLDCVNIEEARFAGECADPIVESLGSQGNTEDTLSRFTDTRYAIGKAHQAYICIARKCNDECF